MKLRVIDFRWTVGSRPLRTRSRTVYTYAHASACGLRQPRIAGILSPEDQVILHTSDRIEDTIALEERGNG